MLSFHSQKWLRRLLPIQNQIDRLKLSPFSGFSAAANRSFSTIVWTPQRYLKNNRNHCAKNHNSSQNKTVSSSAKHQKIRYYSVTSSKLLPPKTNNSSEIPKTLQTVAEWIKKSEDTCQKNILVLCGAGVSVAAGIPDFRTPGTGLYDNLQTYNLPFPEAVFDLDYFRQKPQAFLSLARDIWPGMVAEHSPTLTHSFLALLEEKKVMLRCYTQNIDGLEFLAGVPPKRLVECHGHFRTASCTQCGAPADIEVVKECILMGRAKDSLEPLLCDQCQTGYVKPDIVFFSERLPDRVSELLADDLVEADLLLILGTSLQVAPVAMIPDSVQPRCRRVLLNREFVGNLDLYQESQKENPRDLFHAGDCDESILSICKVLGWEDLLLKRNEAAKITVSA